MRGLEGLLSIRFDLYFEVNFEFRWLWLQDLIGFFDFIDSFANFVLFHLFLFRLHNIFYELFLALRFFYYCFCGLGSWLKPADDQWGLLFFDVFRFRFDSLQ